MSTPLRSVFVATLASCGTPDTTIDIIHDACTPLALGSPAATSAQRAGIEDAIALWRTTGVTSLHLQDSAAVLDIRFERAAAAFHGLYDDERGVIYINATLVDARPLSVVIAHELGHAFGLPHVGAHERRSVMNLGNISVAPTDDDRRELARLWGACDAIRPPAS